jgi:hypothetical protein
MKTHKLRSIFWLFATLVIPIFLIAQSSPSNRLPKRDPLEATSNSAHHVSLAEDWSSRHFVMPGVNARELLSHGVRDPRVIYSLTKHQQLTPDFRRRHPRRHRPIHVDWAISLENGFVPEDQYPAKFQFDITNQDCNSDYLLLGLDVTSGTQANIVGINNLYTGPFSDCNGGNPWVSFAYNTATNAGQILTSPTLSTDGTKVAFVETTSTGSYFHVLVLPSPIPAPPAQDGTVLAPFTPTACAQPITPGCMTTVQFSSTSDSNSSPWIDYNTDIAYVGDDGGTLYKIGPVFGGGAPGVYIGPNWPVTVVSGLPLTVITDPVVDDITGRIFIGDANGYLYSIDPSTPMRTTMASVAVGLTDGGAGSGLVDGPIVVTDPSNPTTNQVFAFTGCSSVSGVGGAISQLSAKFNNNYSCYNSIGCTTVNLGSSDGIGHCTGSNVHNGAFDNIFWSDGSASGHIVACGFLNDGGAPAIPVMYHFPFSAGVVTQLGASTFTIDNAAGDECSPLTEFFDGSTDRLFFGVGSPSSNLTNPDGFIQSSVLTTVAQQPNCTSPPTSSCVDASVALGGTSGIVVDNQLSNGGANIYFSTLTPGSVNGQKCNVAGGAANPYCIVKLTQSGLQ